MAKKKSEGTPRVTNEEFVKGWVKGGTSEDVAERLGISRQTLYLRSRKLREAGVVLEALERKARGAVPIDVKGLNAIIKGAR